MAVTVVDVVHCHSTSYSNVLLSSGIVSRAMHSFLSMQSCAARRKIHMPCKTNYGKLIAHCTGDLYTV